MLTLPVDERSLVAALTHCLRDARAGVLLAEQDDDPEMLAAALDEASERAGTPIRTQWLGHTREVLAWLREDDERLRLMPALTIVGVMM